MTIKYTMEWNEDDIRAMAELAMGVVKRSTELMAQEVWGNIQREAPTDEGKLAGNWELKPQGELDWVIDTMTEYALWVHEGTGIHGPAGHRIVPKTAKALAFEWQGRFWILRSVAGQKPNKYADRAIENAAKRSQEFVEIALREMEAA
jgi:hypothetical protein